MTTLCRWRRYENEDTISGEFGGGFECDGLRAGCVLVFIPALGTYLTSDLLGGSKTILIGNLIQNQFAASRDWPFGAASSFILMAVVMALLLALLRKGDDAVL